MAGKLENEIKNPGKKKGLSRIGKTWLIVVLVVVVVAGVIVIYRARANANAASAYQTTTLARGNLNATIGATGNVRANQTTVLTWQNTGTIGVLNVNPGDQIKAGDVLGSLVFAPLTQSTLESNLVTAQENLAQLTSLEAIANAKLAITTAETNVTNAQYGVNNLQYWQNNSLIQDQYANVVIAKANLDKAQTAYDNANVGPYINNAGEAALYQALYDAQQAYNRAENSYSTYSQKPTQRQIDEAQATLDLANATLEQDKTYLAALTGGSVPADATGTPLLQLKQAQLAVQTAQDNLDSAKLTSTINGTVTEVNGMVGDQVSPGTEAFRVDDLSRLLVDVQVSEVDINNVTLDQPALVTFDAVLGKEYHGKVVEVSRVGTSVQNVVNFNVTVELTDPDADVKPGMTASVTITIQSLQDVLLVPNQGVHLVNSQRVVYILRNGQLLEIPVTLGASDDTMSVVISGDLAAGDVLVLNPPINFRPGQGGGGGGIFGGG
ncbi:MAG: efflux RND transporter periplasmic adaptor subunit [Anaerolineales bacterium]|jgi:HlyD family secretion protein